MGDRDGYFGEFGGRYVPETLIPALNELEQAYRSAKSDEAFLLRLEDLLRDYAGRPTPLYFAERFSEEVGAAVWLKREDLLHTGAHKINNTIGQVLLALRMGKRRIIAETGAGQHGVATATVAARFGLECVVYMGEEDIERQALNVFRMQMLGADVVPVSSGSKTLKDATNEAIRDWVTNVATTFYVIGSVVGPDPYPRMVRDFHRVIGRELRGQHMEVSAKPPTHLVACVGGGSNAIGFFYDWIDVGPRLIGVEAAGEGVQTDRHAATLTKGSPGVLHGARSLLLQDADGQVQLAHSVSAGLDYPGVGPEHAWLNAQDKAEYVSVTDAEAVEAFHWLARVEGIIPALESAHAVAHVRNMAATGLSADDRLVICLSGRGDKDVAAVAARSGATGHG